MAGFGFGFGGRFSRRQQFQVAQTTVAEILNLGVATATLSNPRPVGQYANGDWWVLGPVSITSLSPAGSVQTSGTDGEGAAITSRVIHGTQVNPGNRSFATGGLTANNRSNTAQGWDSLANPIAPTAPYVASANVDPGKTGVPLAVTTGSVMKFVSRLTGLPTNNRPAGDDMVVFTVVDTIPPADAIRPGVSRADKTSLIRRSHFDLSVFNNFTPTASAPTYATVLDWVDRYIEASQPHSINNTCAKGANNHPEYGREIGHGLHQACLALHLNFTAEQKLTLLSHMAAIADDFVSRAEEGGWTRGEGGGNQFKKAIICVVGAALGANRPASWDTWLSFANRNVWGEDGQIFAVSGYDIALPRYTADGRPRSAFTYQMLGSAEWGEAPNGDPLVGGQPERSASQWVAFYREIVLGQLLAGTLAVELTTGAKALWDHPNFWKYIETGYLRRLETAIGADRVTAFANEMIIAYRPADAVAPVIEAATVKNTGIAIRFDKALDEVVTAPATSDFVVNVNGSPVTVNSVSVWRQNCGLVLAAAVTGNDTVTVSYTSGANPLRSARGANVASFSGYALTNQTDKVGGPNAAYPVVRFGTDDLRQFQGTTLAAANSATCTLALLKFKFDAIPASEKIILGTTSGGPPFVMLLDNLGRLEVRFRDASATFVSRLRTPVLTAGVVYDILWSHDVTQDTVAGGSTLYINDVSTAIGVNSYAGGMGKVISFNTAVVQGTYAWNHGGIAFELGAFWMDTTTRVDLTNAANRAKFTSVTSGNLDILTLGNGITGSQPTHFHVGNAGQWNDGFGMNRGTGSKFFVTAGAVELVSGGEWV